MQVHNNVRPDDHPTNSHRHRVRRVTRGRCLLLILCWGSHLRLSCCNDVRVDSIGVVMSLVFGVRQMTPWLCDAAHCR